MITENTKEALNFWLSNSPESYHPCDMDRFYSVIKTSLERGDLDSLVAVDIYSAVNVVNPDWDDEHAREFAAEWEKNISLCKGLIDFLNLK